MATDLNVVALVGRLVRDAELKYSQGGTAVLRFSIAVNRSRKNADGSWDDEVNYFDCVYFGRNAGSVNQYLEKGRQVSIQGELRQSRWEQDGQTRSRVEVFVNNLSLLSSAQNANGGQKTFQNQGVVAGTKPAPAKPAPAMREEYQPGPEDFQDDDIPF